MINWALAKEMVAVGRRLYERGLIVATEGNYSMRIDNYRLFATPKGFSKGELSVDDIVSIDMNGNRLTGKHDVSSEIALHLEVYRQRPEVQAVIHAHPPYCIALMLAGESLDKPLLAESVIMLGKVPTAKFALPSTIEVPQSILPYIRRTDCILLDCHGSLTVGNSLKEALDKLELMEHTAKSYLAALRIGPVKELPKEKIEALMELREKRYKINWPIIPFY
jgi:L-fuculose-phosphate aldolase